jgi:hypothetical protein
MHYAEEQLLPDSTDAAPSPAPARRVDWGGRPEEVAMRRRRLLGLAGLVLVVAIAASGAVLLRREDPRLARSRLIDLEHFDQIREGMRLEKVEAILGGPEGDYQTLRELHIYIEARQKGRFTGQGHEKVWKSDRALIRVYFTERWTVNSAQFSESVQVPLIEEGWSDRFRRLWR